MSKVQYTGHGANTGGLQGHSIGDDYPFMVKGVGVEGDDRTHWVAVNTNTGEEGPRRPTYRYAEQDLKAMKLHLEIGDELNGAAYAEGFQAHQSCSKAGNPYEVDTPEYGLFGKGWYDSVRLVASTESSTQGYQNNFINFQ